MLQGIFNTFYFLKDIFVKYTGTGLYTFLFLACLLYIMLKADKETRQIFALPLLAVLVLVIANPLMVIAWDIIGMDTSVYWRNYWLLMMVETIAYVAVCLVCSERVQKKRLLRAGALACVVVLCGGLMFTSSNYSLATNLYKIEEESIAVADILQQDNIGEKRVAVPAAMVLDIRLYDPNIRLSYGRDTVYNGVVHEAESEDYVGHAYLLCNMLIFQNTPYSPELLQNSMQETNTAYIVQSKDSALLSALNNTSFLQPLAETEENIIYTLV